MNNKQLFDDIPEQLFNQLYAYNDDSAVPDTQFTTDLYNKLNTSSQKNHSIWYPWKYGVAVLTLFMLFMVFGGGAWAFATIDAMFHTIEIKPIAIQPTAAPVVESQKHEINLSDIEKDMPFPIIIPTYIPDTYSLVRAVKNSSRSEGIGLEMVYSNGADTFSILQSKPLHPLHIVVDESLLIARFDVGADRGVMYRLSPDQAVDRVALQWSYHEYSFTIFGSTKNQELVNVAQSMRP